MFRHASESFTIPCWVKERIGHHLRFDSETVLFCGTERFDDHDVDDAIGSMRNMRKWKQGYVVGSTVETHATLEHLVHINVHLVVEANLRVGSSVSPTSHAPSLFLITRAPLMMRS